MKNYFLVLLAVFGLHFAINAGLPVDVDAKTEVISETKSEEAVVFDKINQISEQTLEKIADSAKITPKFSQIVTSVANVATTSISLNRNYNVTNYSPEIVKNPASFIYRTGKLIYAHNASGLFGDLNTLAIGSIFTLTENNVITSYQVSDIKTFEKNPTNGLLQLNGNGNYMNLLVEKAFYHSVALMTCTGTDYGNGDASHRLVVFADQI